MGPRSHARQVIKMREAGWVGIQGHMLKGSRDSTGPGNSGHTGLGTCVARCPKFSEKAQIFYLKSVSMLTAVAIIENNSIK